MSPQSCFFIWDEHILPYSEQNRTRSIVKMIFFWCLRFKIRFETCLNSHLCSIVPKNIQNVLKERVRVLIFYIVKHYNIFYTIHNPLTPKIFLKFFRISKFSCCKWISMTHPWVAGKISYTRVWSILREIEWLKKCFIRVIYTWATKNMFYTWDFSHRETSQKMFYFMVSQIWIKHNEC